MESSQVISGLQAVSIQADEIGAEDLQRSGLPAADCFTRMHQVSLFKQLYGIWFLKDPGAVPAAPPARTLIIDDRSYSGPVGPWRFGGVLVSVFGCDADGPRSASVRQGSGTVVMHCPSRRHSDVALGRANA